MNHTTQNTSGNVVDNTASAGTTAHHGKVSNAINKLRGAAEVINGVGENIRGTTLGAVDQLSNDGNAKNEEIAVHGRVQTQKGLENLGRGQTHGNPTASSNSTQANYGGNTLNTASGNAAPNQGGFQQELPASEYAAHAHDAGLTGIGGQYAPGTGVQSNGLPGSGNVAQGTQPYA